MIELLDWRLMLYVSLVCIVTSDNSVDDDKIFKSTDDMKSGDGTSKTSESKFILPLFGLSRKAKKDKNPISAASKLTPGKSYCYSCNCRVIVVKF